MRLIDADAFNTILENGEIEAKKQRKYVLASALNAVRGNLAKQPSVFSYNCSEIPNNWIPCSERLPEEDGGLYLVTDYAKSINRRRMHLSRCYMNREGFWSDVPIGYKVVAWMPLPEPYSERREE